MNNYPTINIEQTFNQVIREYGMAIVVREALLPKSVTFLNADYIFHSEKIIAELKCLTEDNSQDPNKLKKVERIMNYYFDSGKIKTKVINDQTWLGFPLKLQNSITDVYATSIRDRIRKADEQISSTREKLNLGLYSGLLILANDGLKSLPPAAVEVTALRYIRESRPNIDCMIYVTVNILAELEGIKQAIRFWSFTPMTEPNKVSDLFSKQLCLKFAGLVDRQVGLPSGFVTIPDKDEFLRKYWNAKTL
jgi:hypothetical protein